MAEYIFNKQIANETSIRIETNNREFFIGIEEIINSFLNKFTNENEPDVYDGIELMDLTGFENIEYIRFENITSNGFENENNGANELGIEKPNGFENELQSINENLSDKFCGNELQNTPKVSKRRTKLYPPINTKYGRAYFDKGYYRIRDKTSPYNMKTLHRLIFEEHHRCTLLSHAIIHHIDGDKTNQDISNLQLMSNSEHTILHNQIYGFTTPERTLEHNISISKSQNKSGYFRVSIAKANNKQGFVYRYQYYENGQQKSIRSKNLRRLEKKVKAIGQPWRKL